MLCVGDMEFRALGTVLWNKSSSSSDSSVINGLVLGQVGNEGGTAIDEVGHES